MSARKTEMNDRGLAEDLAGWGYGLLRPESGASPATLLRKVVESKNLRLLEGFPVVLASWVEKIDRNQDMKAEFTRFVQSAFEKSDSKSEALRSWLAVSLALFWLYDAPHFDPHAWLGDDKAREGWTAAAHAFRNALTSPKQARIGNVVVSLERLRTTYLNYVVVRKELAGKDFWSALQRKNEYLTEYHLSILFPPKQKDLVKKKTLGSPLTKVEREYFSRTVRKKLMALANPEIQELARRLTT